MISALLHLICSVDYFSRWNNINISTGLSLPRVLWSLTKEKGVSKKRKSHRWTCQRRPIVTSDIYTSYTSCESQKTWKRVCIWGLEKVSVGNFGSWRIIARFTRIFSQLTLLEHVLGFNVVMSTAYGSSSFPESVSVAVFVSLFWMVSFSYRRLHKRRKASNSSVFGC